ncbi:hypothetical protein [Aquabacterium sp. NJ1]|uniref:hypothetical protein n=1 Tax=Aquabacterium sp. NJ1 TaxID=1538295 RepID=UPI001269A4C9|nr:hypothetical protein [Aquabacterium sp. NJ1]
MHTPKPPPITPMRRRVLALLLGLGAVPRLAMSANKELRIVTAADPSAQRQMLQALRLRYPALLAESDPAVWDAHKNAGPVVTLGPAALRRALNADLRSPLISVLTSSQTYRRLAANLPREAATAIYADASPSAQLQLIAALFERKVTVGVLLSDASAYLEKALRQAAQQYALEILIAKTDPNHDPVRALNGLAGAQVLLAVPDSMLYTPDTLRAVLESTYRRGMPVVGFSAATVAAGTLASAYPDVDDIVADLADLIEGLGTSGNDALPEPRFPHYWRVAVNENVARSLGIAITDKVRALGVHPPGRSG